MKRDFLSLLDLTPEEIYQLLDRADALYDLWTIHQIPQVLQDKRVGLWSQGNGFRNRTAFELGIQSMGGTVLSIPGELGIHEPIEDIGHYLNNWLDLMVVRTGDHKMLERLAGDFKGPVINAKTTYNHPCEVLGDLQFIRRERGTLEGLKVVFVGAVENLCRTWFEAAQQLPIEVVQVAPSRFLPPDADIDTLNKTAKGRISTCSSLNDAVDSSVDLIYTDCWPSASQFTGGIGEVQNLFLPFQITSSVLSKMNPKGWFLPCPPITRGQEVSASAAASPLNRNYDCKNFLLHAQNAILEYLVT